MVSAELVKTLREMTGAGMLECKKALEEAGGDIEKAKEILRIRGLAKADKKAGRETKEGIIYTYVSEDRKKGVIIELNCETDFVAKNEQFVELALKLAKHIASLPDNANKSGTGEDIKDQAYFEDASTSVGALQIAAMKPEFVSIESIDPEALEREKRILTEQARQEGKPENIIEKVVEGRLKKFYQEKVLLEQAFIKDEKKTVGQYIKESATGVEIKRFVRFEVGGA